MVAAPVVIDQGAGDPDFGFVLSGVTGVYAGALNGRYELVDPGVFENASGSRILLESTDFWIFITAGLVTPFMGAGVWPWQITEWYLQEGGAGTPAFSQMPSPYLMVLGGDATAVNAKLTTSLTGANNDVIFTSKLSGRLGNAIRVRYVSPGVNNAALSVVVSGRDITVNLATNGSGQITSTAALVVNAIAANAVANALVEVTSIDGLGGVVTAMGWTSLSGGMGGLPLPPGVLSL